MELLLFGLYLLLFSWIITKVKFFKSSGLTSQQLVILFIIKVIVGIIYGWIGLYQSNVANMVDTWNYHFASLKESELLFTHPKEYLTNLFYNPYENSFKSFFASSSSYWNNLKWNSYTKLISIFNFFSIGNYYINVIFYSFITLFGVVAMYKILVKNYVSPKYLLIIGCFLVPSFIYWSSGLHKDGLTFLGLSIIIYQFQFSILEKNISAKSLLWLMLGFFIIAILRLHVLMVLLPAMFTWFIAEKYPKYKWQIFLGFYCLFIMIFFGLRHIFPQFDFPAIIIEKRNAFANLHGRTTLPFASLEPNFISFLKAAPNAFSFSAIRPYLSDVNRWIVVPSFVEHLIIWLLIILAIIKRKKNYPVAPFSLFVVFFGFSFIVFMIGYSVNNLGATVRYRSIVYPLLITFLLSSIDFKSIFNIKKYNT